MATTIKSRRLVNPGRKKRKLSALQKLFFGSKRQRSAVAKKRNPPKGFRKFSVAKSKAYKQATRVIRKHKRKRNVGSIITVWPKSNPARRKKYSRRKKSNRGKKVIIVNKGEGMAITRRRRSRKARVTRRRRNYGTRTGRSWSTYTKRSGKRRNPGTRRRRRSVSVVGRKRYTRRRHARRSNPGRRRSYRRNPGMLTGTAGRILGVVGGIAVTKLLCSFVPASLQTGPLGYLTTGAVAVLQGKMVGKFSKNASLGNDMLVGGLAYLTAKILNDFFPSIGSYTGISGMGMIGGSSFYTPQVNVNGSMGTFVAPAATRNVISGAMSAMNAKGVGTMRRTGRLM